MPIGGAPCVAPCVATGTETMPVGASLYGGYDCMDCKEPEGTCLCRRRFLEDMARQNVESIVKSGSIKNG